MAKGKTGEARNRNSPHGMDCHAAKNPPQGVTQGKELVMVINTNISALNAANDLDQSNSSLNASLARLSTGSQLVNASDNPAGLAKSISLNAQIGQTTAANDNVGNATSFLQTQDGYLQQVGSALDQMASLAVEAQDGTISTTQAADYQKEFAALGAYITSTASQTFNGVSLFAGTSLVVTTNGSTGKTTLTGINLGTGSKYATAIATSISTSTGAAAALTAVTNAIDQLGTDRAQVGANEETMSFTNQELSVLATNLTAANSQISDVDVATESTNFAKYQILVQSGTSMLAQANQNPQTVLKLIQNI
jgi:flagellin